MRDRARWAVIPLALSWLSASPPAFAGTSHPGQQRRPAAQRVLWKFAISGDSRNCGDVVMPAIAAAVQKSKASFYWHLGDFRKMFAVDEDIQHQPTYIGKPLSLPEYHQMAWDDFIQHQLKPFGALPVFLGIGNHEMIEPKTRADYIAEFSYWLDTPLLRAQRLHDDPSASAPRTYFHWVHRGVDFITLDNATSDQFDAAQVTWFEKTLAADLAAPGIRTIVAGMHEALPGSLADAHSMSETSTGTDSGRRVYADLLAARDRHHKRVYVFASHSHFYMADAFNSPYWRAHGGVLPGWIDGTAGAQRYPLPQDAGLAKAAETRVYGFLIGSVYPGGRMSFAFHRLTEADIPAPIMEEYQPAFVHWCFAENVGGSLNSHPSQKTDKP